MRDPWYGRADTLEQEDKDLIEAACNSFEIKELKYGSTLLHYLAVYSELEFKKRRETGAILEDAFRGLVRRPPDHFNLSLYLHTVQDHLDQFFDNEGGGFERRIKIHFSELGQKRNPFQNALYYPPNRGGEGPYTRLFWKDYLRTKVPTLIAYGVPLFETDSDFENFTRSALQNHEHQLADRTRACYAFVSHGEALAMLDLTTWLAGKGIKVIHKGYSRQHSVADALQEAGEANGILLGAARVNGVLDGYQQYPRFQFVLGDKAVMEHQGGLEGLHSHIYEDRTIINGKLSLAHALISRMPGKRARSITIISANHGRAIQRMGQLFTNESELKQLFESAPLITPLPKEFQLLFAVDIHDKERVPGECRLLKAWFPAVA